MKVIREKMKLSIWQRPSAVVAAIFILIALGFTALRFAQFERESYALPRLFIQLERSIGYGGFIHNFKNYVLRPDEVGYLEAAVENYETAARVLSEINDRAAGLGIPNDLTAVKETFSIYREMLDAAASSEDEQLTIAQVDERVRVSDVDATRNILEFERDILDVMARRRAALNAITVAGVFIVIVGAFLITYVQSRRARQKDQDNLRLLEMETFLLQAERIAHLGRWKTDREGNIRMSDAAGEIYGVEPGGFPEKVEDFWKFVPVEDQDKLRMAVNQALQSNGQFSCLHRILRPDGSTINVVDSGEVVLDDAGKFNGIVGTIQDVSLLVDMENELRQSQKMEAIGNLAGGMAHDFNNILAVILGNLELLQISPDKSEHPEYVENAIDATRRGADLTRNMLGFARRSHLDPRLVQANDLIRDVLGWSSRLLPATIKIETSCLANLWQFKGDEGLAKNALLNLMLNARDAMPDGGRLTIETANLRIDNEYIVDRNEDLTPGRYVMIAVSDTGVGIDEDDLKKVFDPFFSTKPIGQGTGLGLSMVHGFMKQSGGTVRIYSEPGVGTTLKLYFKAEAPAELPQIKSGEPRETSELTGQRVLLVEDNEALLFVLEEMLTFAGLKVTKATSGDEAMAIWCNDRNFDVVATDIVMPGQLQGTHLAKAIRAEDPSVPFIFMSGYANEAMVHGNGLHPQDIRLMKPVNRIELLDAVRKHISTIG